MPLIGAHVSVAHGLATGGLTHAAAVGAEVVQVFVSNPRGWAAGPGHSQEDDLFRGACDDAGIPAYVHAPYLVNFGSPTPETVARSCTAVRHSLTRAAVIGALGVVVHAGSGEGPSLLIEPRRAKASRLCSTVPQLGEYLDEQLIHANDSMDRCGSCRDHHEDIGAGTIGLAGFAELVTRPVVRAVPIVIETPGDQVADAANIATLKQLRNGGGVVSAPTPTGSRDHDARQHGVSGPTLR